MITARDFLWKVPEEKLIGCVLHIRRGSIDIPDTWKVASVDEYCVRVHRIGQSPRESSGKITTSIGRNLEVIGLKLVRIDKGWSTAIECRWLS